MCENITEKYSDNYLKHDVIPQQVRDVILVDALVILLQGFLKEFLGSFDILQMTSHLIM